MLFLYFKLPLSCLYNQFIYISTTRVVQRYNLASILEGAVRASNVQYEESDIIERLDVKTMTPSPGESGWDVFRIDYKVDNAITAVVHHTAHNIYTQLFVFLWKMKRVDYTLGQVWQLQMVNYKKMRTLKPLQGVIHRFNTLRTEIQHFVGVFHTYIMFDVLERCWLKLVNRLSAVKDMDELITAHDEYLHEILNLTLVGGRNSTLYNLLIQIFECILQFSAAHKDLYTA